MSAPVKLRQFAKEENISHKVLWSWIRIKVLPEGVWIRSGRNYWIKPLAFKSWSEDYKKDHIKPS